MFLQLDRSFIFFITKCLLILWFVSIESVFLKKNYLLLKWAFNYVNTFSGRTKTVVTAFHFQNSKAYGIMF